MRPIIMTELAKCESMTPDKTRATQTPTKIRGIDPVERCCQVAVDTYCLFYNTAKQVKFREYLLIGLTEHSIQYPLLVGALLKNLLCQ